MFPYREVPLYLKDFAIGHLTRLHIYRTVSWFPSRLPSCNWRSISIRRIEWRKKWSTSMTKSGVVIAFRPLEGSGARLE